MNIAIIPNALKESASAQAAGSAIARAVSKVCPEATLNLIPVSDGGDGFTDVCINRFAARQINIENTSTYSTFIKSFRAAVLPQIPEWYAATADMFGLAVTPPVYRDPLQLNSAPLASLIAAVSNAVKGKPARINLGIGGTATNDLGIGVCSRFGLQLLDRRGNVLPPVPASFTLARKVLLPRRQEHISIRAVTDVDTPVTGAGSFTETFAPQKGASPKDVLQLSLGVDNLLRLLADANGITFPARWGAGGGLLCGLSLLLNVESVSAERFILDTLGVEEAVQNADIVITSEGRFDRQSLGNKASGSIVNSCKKAGKPCYIICGTAEQDAVQLLPTGISVVEINRFYKSLAESIINPADGITKAALEILAAHKS